MKFGEGYSCKVNVRIVCKGPIFIKASFLSFIIIGFFQPFLCINFFFF
ncbi:hypothetical protein P835_03655 [Citrobacter portucalensis]|nr:hypothetical protein P835_03655 [Citrobacter portucalensis]